jgi:hypothetical protein
MIERFKNRYLEIEKTISTIAYWKDGNHADRVDWALFTKFVTNSLNLISLSLRKDSVHYANLQKVNLEFKGFAASMEQAKGIFLAAKDDYINDYYNSEYSLLSGEILGNFVKLAKAAIVEGKKDVAAVLASAALEDALKNYSKLNGFELDNEEMSVVVNSLKSNGLVSGAQKSLLDVMPKIRNYAMHANWEKITIEDVNSIIGFVEQFILEKF